MAPSQIEIKRSTFPKDFIFGAATSAYQIEGAWNVGSKGRSNWDRMTIREPGSIADGSNGCVAIDHYNKFKEDVALLKKVGLDSYRFSISWPRILPGGKLCGGVSEEGIKYYNDLIDTLLAEGIEPCGTLFHWDVPQCLEDEYKGFLDHQIVEHFGEFAQICFWEFGDRVKRWITLNEPWSFTYCGYVLPRFPPRRGYNLPTSLERLLRSMILDHRSAINVCSLASSEGDLVEEIIDKARSYVNAAREIVDKLRNLPSTITSSEGNAAREIVDKLRNFPSFTSSEGNAVREIFDKAYNFPYVTSSEGDPVKEIIDKAFNLPYVTSSEGDSVKEIIDNTFSLPYVTSSEGDLIKEITDSVKEIIDKAFNLPYVTSSEGDSVKEIIDKAFNLRYVTSSEGDSINEIIDKSYHLPHVTSSEGNTVREVIDKVYNLPYSEDERDGAKGHDYSHLTPREGYPVKILGSEEYYNLPFYEADRVGVSPMAQNFPPDISSSVGESSMTQLPPSDSLEGDPGSEPYTVAHNLRNVGNLHNVHVTSPKGDAVRELIAKVVAFISQYLTPFSEGYAVRELISKVIAYVSDYPNSYNKGDPGTEPYTVAHNLILAHAHAVDIYRKHYQEHQEGKIGMTNMSVWYYPLDETKLEDIEAASRAMDFKLGWFVDPIITGDYPPSMRNNVRKRLPKFTPDEVKLVKGSCDFLGINYYTARYAQNVPRRTEITHFTNDHHVMEHTYRDGKPIGEMGGLSWFFIVPDGIYKMMLYIKERYNNPEILITENGFVDANNKAITISEACIDETRIYYYKEHLAALRKAMDEGVRLKGYFIWSFLDNFEWDSGYNGRFGIFYVDYKSGHLTRYPKNSARWWMNFLKKTRTPWNKVPRNILDVNTEEEERCGCAKKTKYNYA